MSPFWKYCENSSVASSAATSASSSTMVSSNSLVFSSVLGTFSARRFYFILNKTVNELSFVYCDYKCNQ